MVRLLNTTKMYLKPYLALVPLVGEVSLVALSEKVNPFTSTDSDSLRHTAHGGYMPGLENWEWWLKGLLSTLPTHLFAHKMWNMTRWAS